MSGGFFRGTSADQDTRFSNKQAKLLKTQKFAPELEQLVDITKVKMDVMRPWIATRVTDFLGFEDEVLINFIYGLLDGKVVDGRQIQIQLTGFMEKNTGKFMKELWNLLLSAQKNASGVPQQFLDSKEEEMRKKKVETDKLTQEIQRRKERGGWGPEPDRKTRMDDREAKEVQRGANAPTEMKQSAEDGLAGRTKDFLEPDGERSSRRKKRSSPAHFSDDSPSSPRRRRSLPDRSPSRSPLIRRSYSGEIRKSRSVSISPQRQRRSVSRERQFPSPRRHQTAPRQPRSHPHRQSPHARQRSTSRSRHRSPSLPRLRSPIRRRSRSPVRHRARSPIHHKSPSPRYRRSRSPRRRSPVYVRRQSPSPLNRRSPVRRRSPLRHASPSPQRRTSPPIRPQRSQKSPMPSLRRSGSPRKSRSPLHRLHRSPVKGNIDSAKKMELRRTRDDNNKSQISPARHQSEREPAERAGLGSKRGNHAARRMSPTSKSPQHVASNRHDTANSVASKFVFSENPIAPVNGRDRQARQRGISSLSSPARDQETTHFLEEIEYGPGRLEDEAPVVDFSREDWELARGGASPRGKRRQYEKNSVKGSSADKHEINRDGSYSHSRKSRKTEEKNLDAIVRPNCEDDRKYKSQTTERRAPKVGDKDSSSDEAGYDSQVDLKERKRRRKDEKRLRKEEKRRKREERHRRKEERRTSKQKSKYPDDGTSSDYDEQNDNVADHFDDDARMALKSSDNEETESEQKKLEIQLREKALESLRAKKAITN